MRKQILETESGGQAAATNRGQGQKLRHVSFAEARRAVRQLHLRDLNQWRIYCRGKAKGLGPKPYTIPSNPDLHYRFTGWKSWEDFLGTGQAE